MRRLLCQKIHQRTLHICTYSEEQMYRARRLSTAAAVWLSCLPQTDHGPLGLSSHEIQTLPYVQVLYSVTVIEVKMPQRLNETDDPSPPPSPLIEVRVHHNCALRFVSQFMQLSKIQSDILSSAIPI